MAVFETWLKSDLKKPLTVKPLAGNLFSADNQGNLIGVEVMDGGSPAELSGGVTGYVIRADGATLPISGTLAGNRASIVLPASAYAVIGHVSIVIKVGTTTVGACTSYVYQTTTDTVVDPGRVIPSIEELLAQIDACIAATAGATAAAASANTAAANANAKAELADTAAENANTKAGLANTAASAANAAAGKIDNMTVAATTSPEGSQASVTITEVNGHKHVAFGIPKGDKGKDFHIAFTFASIAAMEAYSGDIELFDYAMIDTGNVQDADTGKLYCYEQDEEWHYIGDLSGAQGIKGETGTGIDHVALNNDYTLTIYYDDGTQTTTTSIRGATGITPNIAIGTVTTLLPDQQAYVTRDPSSTAENPVFNFGIPKGDTGAVDNVYGTTVPMSESDSTTVYNAIGSKLNKNQGTANSGKFMKVGADGELTPENVPDPTNKADKVTNATAGNFAGLDATGNLTDSGKSAEDFAGAIYKTATPGSIITIDDGADDLPIKELKVAIDPVQDLNGYDAPWPAGGGKNKCPSPLQTTTTESGLTFTCDGKGECTLSGTASSGVVFNLSIDEVVLPSTVYVHLFNSNYFSSNTPIIDFMNGSTVVDFVGINVEQNRIYNGTTDMGGKTINGIRIRVPSGFTGSVTFKLYISDSDAVVDFAPYSNICPITGLTGAKVNRTGKNLLDPKLYSGGAYNPTIGSVWNLTVSSNQLSDIGNGQFSITLGNWAFRIFVFDLVDGQSYSFRCDFAGTDIAISYGCLDENNTVLTKYNETGATIYNNITFTGSNKNKKAYVGFAPRLSEQIITLTKPQLELGSTATAYEPYQGETYDITFPSEAGTVYGGTLTVNEDGTGRLSVDSELEVFDTVISETEIDSQLDFINMISGSINVIGDYTRISFAGPMNRTKYNLLSNSYEHKICNMLPHYFAYNQESLHWYRNTVLYAFFPVSVVGSTKESVIAYLKNLITAGTPLTFWIPLATPVTYQLTPQEIRTLLGVNNIWADTGDITKLIYSVNTDTAMALYEKADKVSGATYGDLAKLDSQGNFVDSGIASENVVVKADIASKEWEPETGDTLLSFINSNCNFAALPFSFAKTGSAVPADTPAEIAGSMFTGICIGHDGYITVKIQAFSTTATQYTFERDYYQGSWRTNWASIGAALQADVNSTQDGVAIVAVGDTHDAISSGQFVFVRSHSTLAKGMYKATAAIAANGALSTSNLTADDSGGLNDLQSQVTALNSKIPAFRNGITVVSFVPGTPQTEQVTFDSPMPDNQYSVSLTQEDTAGIFADITFGVTSRTANGFVIRSASNRSGTISVDIGWIAIEHI